MVRIINSEGEVEIIAKEIAGTNGIAYAPDGRLFFTQVDAGDTVYELGADRAAAPRVLWKGIGGQNGIEVGAQRLIAIDPISGDIDILVEDLPIGLTFKSFMPTFLPTGVVIDEGGAIYLASDLDYSLLKITERP